MRRKGIRTNSKFVVLEAKGKNDYARIHRANCGHARKPGAKTATTVSHGYFDTYLEARDFASSLELKDGVKECHWCSPRHY